MIILKKIEKLKEFLKNLKSNASIGLIPTMGDIHQGHLSLIQRAKQEVDVIVVSIFVNQLQFNDQQDYDMYIRNESQDCILLESMGVDIVFIPSEQEIYPYGYTSLKIQMKDFNSILCGQFRKGHFDGIITIILKLFLIINPHKAYFGYKDYQQYFMIKRMVKDFYLDISIIGCPIIRESSGLALSSRNKRLSQEEHKRACRIFSSLRHCAEKLDQGNSNISMDELKNMLIQRMHLSTKDHLEYFHCIDINTLDILHKTQNIMLMMVSVYIGNIRLIDNHLSKF